MSTIHSIPKSVKSLAGYARKYSRPLALGTAAMVLVNILDLLLPLIMRGAIDSLVPGATHPNLVSFALAYAAVTVLQAVCRFTWRMSLNWAGIGVAEDNRNVIADVAIGTDSDVSGGLVTSLVNSDAEGVARVFDSGVIITIDALFGVVAVPIVLFSFDPYLAVCTLAPLPCVSVMVLYFDRLIKARYSVGQERLGAMTGVVEETLTRIRSVKVNTAEPAFIERFALLSGEYLQAARRLTATEALFGPAMEIVVSVSLVLLFLLGGGSVIEGTLTLGTFVAFQRYIEKLLWPMNALALALTTFKKGSVSMGRIHGFVGTERAGDSHTPSTPEPHSVLVEIVGLKVNRDPEREVLHDICLRIVDSEKIALVGPTGSGKSTLAWAIGGLLPKAEGTILIRNVDVPNLSRTDLTSIVALVPQEVFLFGTSVRENLLLGLPRGGECPNDAELLEVLDVCGIREEVEALPKALDTILGERGLTLSGGQRQRLTLARAVLRRPALLVLDNALSAVDAGTEAHIIERLQPLRCAILCITHRLSTAQAMHRVVVLEQGRKTQDGAREALAREEGGWFKAFCDEQCAEAELAHYA